MRAQDTAAHDRSPTPLERSWTSNDFDFLQFMLEQASQSLPLVGLGGMSWVALDRAGISPREMQGSVREQKEDRHEPPSVRCVIGHSRRHTVRFLMLDHFDPRPHPRVLVSRDPEVRAFLDATDPIHDSLSPEATFALEMLIREKLQDSVVTRACDIMGIVALENPTPRQAVLFARSLAYDLSRRKDGVSAARWFVALMAALGAHHGAYLHNTYVAVTAYGKSARLWNVVQQLLDTDHDGYPETLETMYVDPTLFASQERALSNHAERSMSEFVRLPLTGASFSAMFGSLATLRETGRLPEEAYRMLYTTARTSLINQYRLAERTDDDWQIEQIEAIHRAFVGELSTGAQTHAERMFFVHQPSIGAEVSI